MVYLIVANMLISHLVEIIKNYFAMNPLIAIIIRIETICSQFILI
jgi:hypothetical protein